MGKMVDIKKAVIETGISQYYLRKGVKEKRYPHKKSGLRGKIIFDLDLLEEAIRQEMLENVAARDEPERYGRIRALK